MDGFKVHDLAATVTVRATRDMEALPPDLDRHVETLWQSAARRVAAGGAGRLFNGRVFSAEVIARTEILGHFTEYRRLVAQMEEHALFADLRIRSLSVCGVLRCPDGVAIAPDGDVLVWCSFSRSVRRVDTVGSNGKLLTAPMTNPATGPKLVASSFDEKQHEGLELFHTASSQVSQGGALACASCHPDGRADGLSWRIDKHELQTPVLIGRVAGTHPYKWDGGDVDIKASLTGTMKRLGGSGLNADQTGALASYLEALPAPQAPTRDTQMVARGEKLFDSAELGCRSCHDGAKYTDNTKHDFKAATLLEADTPSLIGLAAGAPYYHDGSAATLESLLRDRGKVHGMAETAKLSDKQVADLIAFLETL